MKYFALLVGVDELDHKYYGDNKDLCSSLIDIRSLSDLITENSDKFEIERNLWLRNSKDTKFASVLNDLNFIKREVNQSNEKVFVFLYYTGHGASIKNPYDPDKKKQYMCLYDQFVLEDILQEKLCEFNSNAHIYVLMDTCHSEGFYGGKQKDFQAFRNKKVKSLQEEFDKIYESDKKYYDRTIFQYQNFEYQPKAQILYQFACKEGQTTETSGDCDVLSDFTGQFLFYRNMVKSDPNQNYYTLSKKLNVATNDRSVFRPLSEIDFFKQNFPFNF